MITIYCIRNIIDGRRYIGQTGATPQSRWSSHLSNAKNGKDSPLWKALREFGSRAFVLEVLERGIPTSQAGNAAERRWIAHFNTTDEACGYNKSPGGTRLRRDTIGGERVQILVRKDTERALIGIAKAEGVSLSALVRRVLTEHVQSPENSRLLAGLWSA